VQATPSPPQAFDGPISPPFGFPTFAVLLAKQHLPLVPDSRNLEQDCLTLRLSILLSPDNACRSPDPTTKRTRRVAWAAIQRRPTIQVFVALSRAISSRRRDAIYCCLQCLQRAVEEVGHVSRIRSVNVDEIYRYPMSGCARAHDYDGNHMIGKASRP
jgi:hypothetical protein